RSLSITITTALEEMGLFREFILCLYRGLLTRSAARKHGIGRRRFDMAQLREGWVGTVRARLVRRNLSSYHIATNAIRKFKFKSRTRIKTMLVHFDSEVRKWTRRDMMRTSESVHLAWRRRFHNSGNQRHAHQIGEAAGLHLGHEVGPV